MAVSGPRCLAFSMADSCCRCALACSRGVIRYGGVWERGLWSGMSDDENEPRQMSWLVCCDSPPGIPTSWVLPLVCLPPPILHPACTSCPHPYRKGRGGWGCILASEGAAMLLIEPTSLKRGERLMAEATGDVGGRAEVVVEIVVVEE